MKMKVQQVHIRNFQKHSDLKLDFNSDVNIITGLTDSGKSGIFRALEWVFNFSNISENDYRKEGTNETSVKIWLDNNFQVERIRSNTLNRYILSKDDYEDKIFKLTILADLPDPNSSEFYQGWLQKGNEWDEDYSMISLGKMTLAKGGWMLNFQSTTDYSEYDKALVSKEKTFDKNLEESVLEGTF